MASLVLGAVVIREPSALPGHKPSTRSGEIAALIRPNAGEVIEEDKKVDEKITVEGMRDKAEAMEFGIGGVAHAGAVSSLPDLEGSPSHRLPRQ